MPQRFTISRFFLRFLRWIACGTFRCAAYSFPVRDVRRVRFWYTERGGLEICGHLCSVQRCPLFCLEGQDALCRSEIRSFFGGIGRVWCEAGNIPEQAMNWGDGLFLGQNCRKCAPLLRRRRGTDAGLRANRLGHTRLRGVWRPRVGMLGSVLRRFSETRGLSVPRRPRRSC